MDSKAEISSVYWVEITPALADVLREKDRLADVYGIGQPTVHQAPRPEEGKRYLITDDGVDGLRHWLWQVAQADQAMVSEKTVEKARDDLQDVEQLDLEEAHEKLTEQQRRFQESGHDERAAELHQIKKCLPEPESGFITRVQEIFG